MTNKWRPEMWKNPYQEKISDSPDFAWANALQDMRQTAFEEGADAMLDAIEKKGDIPSHLVTFVSSHTSAGTRPGFCLFPTCRNLAEGHGYCQEHYERLNKVT